MTQGRTLPLLGPAIFLYLVVESFSRAEGRLDRVEALVWGVGFLAALLPLVLQRFEHWEELHGARRFSTMSTLLGIALLSIARSDTLSPTLEVVAALSWPPVGALALDLTFDTPDRPPTLQRLRPLRWLGYTLALVSMGLALLSVLPAPNVGQQPWVVPASLARAVPAYLLVILPGAFALRTARRHLGSTPESLASNGWALLGLAAAIALGGSAVLARWASAVDDSVARVLLALGSAGLVIGHAAMLDARRPVRAAAAARQIVATASTFALLLGGAWSFADEVPREPTSFAAATGLFLLSAAILHRVAGRVVYFLLAPDRGRLLDAIHAAERNLRAARSLDELGVAVLRHLARAARSVEAEPLLQTIAPARQIRLDAAGLPRIESRSMAAALLQRLSEKPGDILVAAPLKPLVVRRPDLRPLIDALEAHDALCAVPISEDGDLEGALMIPRGKRASPLTLEELAALERLASQLIGALAVHQTAARAHQRATASQMESERHLERIEELEDEIARSQAEARVSDAGRVEERYAAPLVAYSESMRKVAAQAEQVSRLDAPVWITAEPGSDVESLAYEIHRSGPRAGAPFVVADCSAVRGRQTSAYLFGDEDDARVGWLRLARTGTLVLLELPALDLETQAQLAEAIATRSARGVNSASTYSLDARVIVHSRVEPEELLENGALDADLARRLETFRLRLPPLRERPEDLHSLVLLALDRSCRSLGREVLGIEDSAFARLRGHDWPFNLDELQRTIDHAARQASSPRVREADLPALASTFEDIELGTWAIMEQRMLQAALERSQGNKSEAARLLGLKRTTFLDKLKRAGMDDTPGVRNQPAP